MELNELRQHWQQPQKITEAVFSSTQLNALLHQQRNTLLDKMRRNTYLEIALASVTIIVFALERDYRKPLDVLGTVIQVIMLLLLLRYYYHRVWGILRQMAGSNNAVRGHLEQLCKGFRQLLRLYYRFSIAAVPVTLIIVSGYIASSALMGIGPIPRAELVVFMIVMLFVCLLLMIPMLLVTPWWLQRLYGRHLDHLEASLAELAEPEPATTP
ncbi:MAG: hypothetical protein M3Y12_13500 [Bacteroidota bacterium]|nr:hypothetical protein [Bacteroidota bacterium]